MVEGWQGKNEGSRGPSAVTPLFFDTRFLCVVLDVLEFREFSPCQNAGTKGMCHNCPEGCSPPKGKEDSLFILLSTMVALWS